jgi:hypothetical protein
MFIQEMELHSFGGQQHSSDISRKRDVHWHILHRRRIRIQGWWWWLAVASKEQAGELFLSFPFPATSLLLTYLICI